MNINKLDQVLRAADGSIVGCALASPGEDWANTVSFHRTESGVSVRVDWDHEPTDSESGQIDPLVTDENLRNDPPEHHEKSQAKKLLRDKAPEARAVRAILSVIAKSLPTTTRRKLEREFQKAIDEED